jgi:hypothetical protein
MAKDSDPEFTGTIFDEEIRKELEEDACWAANQGNIWVYILKISTRSKRA